MSQDDRGRLPGEWTMVLEPLCCPHCPPTTVVKHGQSGEGQQRDRCQNVDCARASVILDAPDRGQVPEVKPPVSEWAMNRRGIRESARGLQIRPTSVIEALPKTSISGLHQPERLSLPLRTAPVVRGCGLRPKGTTDKAYFPLSLTLVDYLIAQFECTNGHIIPRGNLTHLSNPTSCLLLLT